MFDPITQGLRAVSLQSPYAFPLVFLAGATTSFGPCVAPRFLTIAGLASNHDGKRARVIVGCFVAGLSTTYASFGAVASLLARAVHFSTAVYMVLAAFLGIAGLTTLWKESPEEHRHVAGNNRSLDGVGASFLLGSSFAVVVSPCCTPVILGILAYTSAAGDTLYGSAALAAYALGHALPLLAVACGARGISVVYERFAIRKAAPVVSAALILAMAVYYMVLA